MKEELRGERFQGRACANFCKMIDGLKLPQPSSLHLSLPVTGLRILN